MCYSSTNNGVLYLGRTGPSRFVDHHNHQQSQKFHYKELKKIRIVSLPWGRFQNVINSQDHFGGLSSTVDHGVFHGERLCNSELSHITGLNNNNLSFEPYRID